MRENGSLDYVHKYYSLMVEKGMRVKTFAGQGIVVGGSNYVHVRMFKDNQIEHFHPQDVAILCQCSCHVSPKVRHSDGKDGFRPCPCNERDWQLTGSKGG